MFPAYKLLNLSAFFAFRQMFKTSASDNSGLCFFGSVGLFTEGNHLLYRSVTSVCAVRTAGLVPSILFPVTVKYLPDSYISRYPALLRCPGISAIHIT